MITCARISQAHGEVRNAAIAVAADGARATVAAAAAEAGEPEDNGDVVLHRLGAGEGDAKAVSAAAAAASSAAAAGAPGAPGARVVDVATAGTEARLGQVFLNLIVNAAHSIREGDAEHNRITGATSVDRSCLVLVEFRDTGSGIAPESLPRIFDAFYTTKPVGVGTGLGLSICHRIVSSLGGELEVVSMGFETRGIPVKTAVGAPSWFTAA